MPGTNGRRGAYLAMMATCLLLWVGAFVLMHRIPGVLVAIMFVVAALIPPAAAIVANAGVLESTDTETDTGPDHHRP